MNADELSAGSDDWSFRDRSIRMGWRCYGYLHRATKPLHGLKRLTRLLVGPPYHETVYVLVMPALKAKAENRGDGSKPFWITFNKYKPSRFAHGIARFEWTPLGDTTNG